MKDYVKLEFVLPSGAEESTNLEEYVESQILARVPAEKHVEYDGLKRILTYEHTDIDEAGIGDFFQRAREAEAMDAVVTVRRATAREELLFANPEGDVELFGSREELEAARGAPEATTAIEFDYGRPGDANTLLIRLWVKSSERRQAIVEMFRPMEDFRTPKMIKAFETEFAGYTDESGVHRVKWPGYCGSDEQWHWGPANMLDGFLFVVVDGEYVYLGFDMSNINRDQESMKNFVATFRPEVFGTNGVWAKLRTISGTKEKFYFEQGGELQFTMRERSDDSLWPVAG